MARLGTVTLQALDATDVFLKEDVFPGGTIEYGEAVIRSPLQEPWFDYEMFDYVSGQVPEEIPVTVEGDTSVIFGWFKSDEYLGQPFAVRVYIVYEEEDLDNDGEPDNTANS